MAFTVKNHRNPEDGFRSLLGEALEDIEKRVTDYSDASPGLGAVSGMGVVLHLADAATARPSDYAVYTWIGSVQPNNLAEYDIWIDTSV